MIRYRILYNGHCWRVQRKTLLFWQWCIRHQLLCDEPVEWRVDPRRERATIFHSEEDAHLAVEALRSVDARQSVEDAPDTLSIEV